MLPNFSHVAKGHLEAMSPVCLLDQRIRRPNLDTLFTTKQRILYNNVNTFCLSSLLFGFGIRESIPAPCGAKLAPIRLVVWFYSMSFGSCYYPFFLVQASFTYLYMSMVPC